MIEQSKAKQSKAKLHEISQGKEDVPPCVCLCVTRLSLRPVRQCVVVVVVVVVVVPGKASA